MTRRPRPVRLSIALAAGLLAPLGLQAAEPEIVVEASTAREEIERILAADNLDLDALSPAEIAATMARIPRGRAPQDFWDRYQGHVRAWQWYAAISELRDVSGHDVLRAKDLVDASFSEVEQVAISYGARLPVPRRGPRSAG